MEEYEGDFYISKSALELLAEEAEKQDFLKTTGLNDRAEMVHRSTEVL